jgi:hypothetical protein
VGTSLKHTITTALAAVETARVRETSRGYDVRLGKPHRATAYRVAALILGSFAADKDGGYVSVEVRDDSTVRVRSVVRILRPYRVRFEYPDGVKGSQAHRTLDEARSFADEVAGRGAAVVIEDRQTGQRLAV